MRHLLPLIHLTAGQVSAASGDTATALTQFAQAETEARQLGMRPVTWPACAGAADVLAATGRTAQAHHKRLAACQVIDAIAADIEDESLRAGFLRHASGRLTRS